MADGGAKELAKQTRELDYKALGKEGERVRDLLPKAKKAFAINGAFIPEQGFEQAKELQPGETNGLMVENWLGGAEPWADWVYHDMRARVEDDQLKTEVGVIEAVAGLVTDDVEFAGCLTDVMRRLSLDYLEADKSFKGKDIMLLEELVMGGNNDEDIWESIQVVGAKGKKLSLLEAALWAISDQMPEEVEKVEEVPEMEVDQTKLRINSVVETDPGKEGETDVVYQLETTLKDGTPIGVYGLADVHGDEKVKDLLKESIFDKHNMLRDEEVISALIKNQLGGGKDQAEVSSFAITVLLSNAVDEVRHQLENEDKDQGGAYLSFVVVIGDQFAVGQVGENKAYQVEWDGQLKDLTTNRSEDDLGNTNHSIKQEHLKHIDIVKGQLKPGDQLLIGSDGLLDEIQDYSGVEGGLETSQDWGILSRVFGHSTASEALKKMIGLARKKGSKEQATGLVIELDDEHAGERAEVKWANQKARWWLSASLAGLMAEAVMGDKYDGSLVKKLVMEYQLMATPEWGRDALKTKKEIKDGTVVESSSFWGDRKKELMKIERGGVEYDQLDLALIEDLAPKMDQLESNFRESVGDLKNLVGDNQGEFEGLVQAWVCLNMLNGLSSQGSRALKKKMGRKTSLISLAKKGLSQAGLITRAELIQIKNESDLNTWADRMFGRSDTMLWDRIGNIFNGGTVEESSAMAKMVAEEMMILLPYFVTRRFDE